MKRVPNIDKILNSWPYEPNSVSVRMAKGSDGRDILQMRIEMGILQLETSGRPDGSKPFDQDTYFDYLISQSFDHENMVMTDDQCVEVDREFVQYYHRRICWLALREFGNAVRDADHTLGLMDFCKEHSPDESWTMTHEQYRPFVMFHRIQASALDSLENHNAEKAVETINAGLESLRQVFAEHEVEDEFEDNELIERLIDLRESLREKFAVGPTLRERLDAAVAAEQYELAAELRDKLQSRSPKA